MVWTLWRREKLLLFPAIEHQFLSHPDRSLVIILTDLAWLSHRSVILDEIRRKKLLDIFVIKVKR
jgi:hypothetical protein